MFPNFKIYCNPIVIIRLWHWHEERLQTNEKILREHSRLRPLWTKVLIRVINPFNRKSMASSTNGAGIKEFQHEKK